MNQNSGMASLWAATCLIFIISLLGWITHRSVISETRRSQQQLFAAQALASSESLLETAIAQIDSVYTGQDIAIDTSFGATQATANASPPWHHLNGNV